MKGLQGERLRQAFRHFDRDQDGFITPDQFKRIIMVWHLIHESTQRHLTLMLKELAGHKLSDAVVERLPTLCTLAPSGKISYSEVIAFHNVLRGMLFLPLQGISTHLHLRNGYG